MTGTLILDSEGLSRMIAEDRATFRRLAGAIAEDARVTVCAMTIVEATHGRTKKERLAWTLSRVFVEPVTHEIAGHACMLLRAAGNLHGHKHAIDAVVAATAIRSAGPVTVLTSDPEDMSRLCGPQVKIVKI
jgi:predicted nucleic acid-binding protein